MSELLSKHSKPLAKGTPPLDRSEVLRLLEQAPGYEIGSDGKSISKKYHFKNFYETMAFVNALAWIAHREDHHPDLEVGYNACRVTYATHSIGGISENDLICAAKVEALSSGA
jgi:4a-hydroxytetrahydrobiopterin dehydratase